MPSFNGGDDFVGVSCPCEGLRFFIVLGQEAVDCGLQVDDRMKDAAPEAAPCQLGEEALDRVEPGA